MPSPALSGTGLSAVFPRRWRGRCCCDPSLDEEYFLSTGFTDDKGNAFYYDNFIALILTLERYSFYVQNEMINA
jgi:hypothetical protein